MLMIRVLQGPSNAGDTFNLETGGSYIIGRADGVDIQLRSSGVSKNHCRISVLPGNRLEVEDLGSSNGTFVNGLLVKRHILKPGDTLNIHKFVLKLLQKAPEKIVSIAPQMQRPSPGLDGFNGNAALDLSMAPNAQVMSSAQDPQTTGEKVEAWLSNNVFPVADSLSKSFDMRFLLLTFFVIWSVLIIAFTAYPFSQEANNRVQNQTLEVAKLYSRQMVRVNTQAIFDQRYRDLVATLDAVQGQTKGMLAAYIIDTEKQQILAPATELGKSFPNLYAQKAIAAFSQDSIAPEFAAKGPDGVAYVAAPIIGATSDGKTRTVAMSFVMFDMAAQNFTVAGLFDQIVSSLLYSLLVSSLFLIFVYRWTDGSLSRLSDRISYAMKRGDPSVSSPVLWPSMNSLSEQVSFALGKAMSKAQSSPSLESATSEWAQSIANGNALPGAAFDGGFVVQAWNDRMSMLSGVDASSAIGNELSSFLRDMDLEQTLKAMASDASMTPWVSTTRDYIINGNSIKLNLVFGGGVYLLLASPGDSG